MGLPGGYSLFGRKHQTGPQVVNDDGRGADPSENDGRFGLAYNLAEFDRKTKVVVS